MWVSKEFNFCYGHILPNHPGKCKNLHGHNGKLIVSIWGIPMSESGMVIDFGDLKLIVNTIVEKLDHAFIVNEFTPKWLVDHLAEYGLKTYQIEGQSTAENISNHIHKYLKDWWKDEVRVEFWETPSSYVTIED